VDLGLSGRTGVVTGASAGIGRAIAETFASEGMNVVLLARSPEPLEQAAKQLADDHGVDVLAQPTDITDRAAVDAAAAAAAERFGAVHVVVNNAGHRMRKMDRQLLWDDEDWQGDLNHKIVGALRVVRAFLPHLATDGTGRVVNVGGVAGNMVLETALTHGLNNAAMAQSTGYLARDLADSGITVNTVVPGLVGTEWRHGWAQMMGEKTGQGRDAFLTGYLDKIGVLSGRWAEPREVADLVAFVASDRGAYINATSLYIDGGLGANVR
jgi:3-oxoacyl-[acyl-carrier protein] reductase